MKTHNLRIWLSSSQNTKRVIRGDYTVTVKGLNPQLITFQKIAQAQKVGTSVEASSEMVLVRKNLT